MLGLVGGQAKRKRERVLVHQVDQGAKKVVPGAHKGEYRDHREGRFGKGNDDVGEDTKLAAAIQFGGFAQFHGDRLEELAEQED